MIDLLVVLRAEDAVLDFLSVLTAPDGGDAGVLVADRGTFVPLPAGAGLSERLELLGAHVSPLPAGGPDAGPAAHLPESASDALAAAVLRAAGGRPARLWTHSPADNRRTRGRLGRDVAAAGHGLPVSHAVGHSPYLQVVSDRDVPLDSRQAAAKAGFVNRFCSGLLLAGTSSSEAAEYVVDTARVPAAERFFAARAEERDRLFALLGSLGDDAATVADPWEFGTSAYEAERLDATAAWIARHRSPDDGPLVELGACEGALTARLAGKGFTVHATEPNPAFHARLAATATPGVSVHRRDLADLAAGRGPRGGAVLLVEMLYYGQPLHLLDELPGDVLFVALAPETLDTVLAPWLETSPRWREAERTRLVAPRLEAVCAGRAYLGKRGSTGVLLGPR